MEEAYTLRIRGWTPDGLSVEVPAGTNVRQLLLKHTHSPYTYFTKTVNCGGRGICATCGVWVLTKEVEASHWHDRAAAAWGYPRLSCQLVVDRDMAIARVPDKWIWGGRKNKSI